MVNLALLIAYDGTHYKGWQKTEMGPSVEETLGSLLEQIFQKPLYLQAASRTDAGVHANGQVVNFQLSFLPDLNKLYMSLNLLLPKDIRVLSIEHQKEDFHPTLDCVSKEYHYYLCFGPIQLPLHRHYSWHLPYKLDFEKIQKALPYFIGTHNFQSFCNCKINNRYTNYERTINKLTCEKIDENRLVFKITGSHFLYKMVRNIVGTLAYIGAGKINSDELPLIFASHKRNKAGITAPAHGLFLHTVNYSQKKNV